MTRLRAGFSLLETLTMLAYAMAGSRFWPPVGMGPLWQPACAHVFPPLLVKIRRMSREKLTVGDGGGVGVPPGFEFPPGFGGFGLPGGTEGCPMATIGQLNVSCTPPSVCSAWPVLSAAARPCSEVIVGG